MQDFWPRACDPTNGFLSPLPTFLQIWAYFFSTHMSWCPFLSFVFISNFLISHYIWVGIKIHRYFIKTFYFKPSPLNLSLKRKINSLRQERRAYSMSSIKHLVLLNVLVWISPQKSIKLPGLFQVLRASVLKIKEI